MLVLIMRTPFHWVYFVYTFPVTYIDFCLYKRHKLTILFNCLVTFLLSFIPVTSLFVYKMLVTGLFINHTSAPVEVSF